MSKTILIAPNSFKGNLSASEISSYIADELNSKLHNKFSLVKLPLTDGGDGFAQIIKDLFNTESIFIKVDYSYDSDEELEVPVEYFEKRKIVFIETANILGLKVVPPILQNPLTLSSRGLGQILKRLKASVESNEIEIDEVVIGLGGTATQDLGLGALSEFGLRLFHFSKYIPIEPKFFARADRIFYNASNFEFPFKINFVMDVNNILLGENGSNFTYARQKGANEEEISYLEKGFKNILRLLHYKSVETLPGAAGGIAAGFKILVNQTGLISAEDFIIKYLGLNNYKNFDYVITGEGKLDETTFNGKAPSVVINKFNQYTKKIFFVCGSSEYKNNNDKIKIISLSEILGSVDSAKGKAKIGLSIASEKIAEMILEE